MVSAKQHTRIASVTSSGVTCGSEGDIEAREPLKWWLQEDIQSCLEEEWLCYDGIQCISYNVTCSGVAECDDGSDKWPRFCGECRHTVLSLV